jgi:hypothetical protein
MLMSTDGSSARVLVRLRSLMTPTPCRRLGRILGWDVCPMPLV